MAMTLRDASAEALTLAETDVPAAAARFREHLAQLPTPEARDPQALALLDALDTIGLVQQGQFPAALQRAVPALAQLEVSPWADRLEWLYTSLAFALGMLGDTERGLAWVTRALRLTQARPHSECRRRALSTQGTLLAMLEQWEPARETLAQSLALAQANGHVRGEVVARCNLANVSVHEAWGLDPEDPRRVQLGRQALAQATPSRAQAESHGLVGLAGLAANVEGFGHLLSGDAEAAVESFRCAMPWTADNPSLHAETQLGWAVLHRLAGDWDVARAALARAEWLAREAHLPQVRGWTFDEGMRLESAAGRHDEALAWARRGIQHWKEQLSRRVDAVSQSASLFEELEHSRREAAALRQQAMALKDAALQDPLTGALNRRGLATALATSAWRDPAQPAVAVLIDADHFKAVNDTHGHAVGDAVLVRLVRLMQGLARQGDLVVRWGGEEFLLLLPHTELAGGLAVAERLRHAVGRDDWQRLAAGLAVTASLGLAAWGPGEALDDVLARADVALYRAKQGGRNRTEAG
ncbi:MAG: GGDEF domain-containing protein [Inhella sp.]|uniref:tetratricopeptide repeat-containing diguanylate cyclase n=2 Tax=Inhella sp. TaxID=1921806 RepID=UPI0022BDAA08|nr:GGDEF domain-containing protein [Inhella sp.]MCZ8236089.1 GGDEF domain-containing protein [Inhella sp.]